MSSVAERRRRKAGRPRAAGSRKPCGRLRDPLEREQEAAILATVLERRVRLGQAATLEDARDPRSGYALGRLWRDGAISQGHHDAGRLLAERYARNLLAIDAPKRTPAISSYDTSSGERSPIRPEQAARWRQEWMEALTALTDCGMAGEQEVRAVAIDDKPAQDVVLLRFTLGYLAKRFKIPLDD